MSKVDDLVREGLARHQAGRRDEAEAFYLKALAKQPSHPAANHLLGVLFLQSGRAADAVTRLQRAVRLHRSAEYLGNLGTALNAAGQPLEALAAFDAALALQPESQGVLNNRGMALKALLRHDEAVASYQKAIGLLPREAGFHRNLGNALAELGDWHGAEAAYRTALSHRPGLPNAVTGLCNALLALNRHADATREMADLAAQFPLVSEIHRALGHAHWQSGNPEAAAAAYREAITVDPADVEAHRMLGQIVARQDEDKEVQAVQRLLASPGLSDNQRAQLEFTLGQAFEDMGQGDRAFDHFQRANQLVRSAAPYDLAAGIAQIDAIISSFAALPNESLPPLQPPAGPIFIVGLPRSGKTTLESLLARHPDLFAAGELGTLGIMAASVKNGGLVAGTALAPPAARSLGERYMAMAAGLAPGRRIIDTMPNNFMLVGLIRQALPAARIVFCQRDPREHAAALFSKYYAQSGNGYAAALDDTHAYLAATDRLRMAWAQRFPDFVLALDTGRLRSDLAATWRGIAVFLGLSPLSDLGDLPLTEPRLGGDPARSAQGRAPLLQAIDRLSSPPGESA